ncbi:MAG: hypothetical protein PVSMB4_08140 [Ktedonobacterales bacterium]
MGHGGTGSQDDDRSLVLPEVYAAPLLALTTIPLAAGTRERPCRGYHGLLASVKWLGPSEDRR